MSDGKGRQRGTYMISAVAELYDIHPQTLRLYEREGLLHPQRSEGNTRLYSDVDLTRLELILTLTRELGVNLAGVEVILNMRSKLEDLQSEVAALMGYVRDELLKDEEALQQRFKQALVKIERGTLVQQQASDSKRMSRGGRS
ncbi:MAG: heat shock protein transcriptional repressor HspR [Acidobacteriota bacterium]